MRSFWPKDKNVPVTFHIMKIVLSAERKEAVPNTKAGK
jgi:hypothetical protein